MLTGNVIKIGNRILYLSVINYFNNFICLFFLVLYMKHWSEVHEICYDNLYPYELKHCVIYNSDQGDIASMTYLLFHVIWAL